MLLARIDTSKLYSRMPLETMKYSRLLSISIAVGILLSGCCKPQDTAVMSAVVPPMTPSVRSSRNDILHVAPLPGYVKHNQGLEIQNRGLGRAKPGTVTAKSTAYISVHLIPSTVDNQVIEYWITDRDGKSGAKHSQYTNNNETGGSTLFTTTFAPGADVDVVRTTPDKNEVIIKGKGADGNQYAWTSASAASPANDDDVSWSP
jgi:hypothetical protein